MSRFLFRSRGVFHNLHNDDQDSDEDDDQNDDQVDDNDGDHDHNQDVDQDGDQDGDHDVDQDGDHDDDFRWRASGSVGTKHQPKNAAPWDPGETWWSQMYIFDKAWVLFHIEI